MPFVQRMEHSSLSGWYILVIWQIFYSNMNYQLLRCFPDFPEASYGEQLWPTWCWWIHHPFSLGFLVADQYSPRIPGLPVRECLSYLPNQFARQFEYDQLYVGNSNLGLHFSRNLYEEARVWYFNVVGGTKTRFNLPQKTPNSYASLRFCVWYVIADSVPG